MADLIRGKPAVRTPCADNLSPGSRSSSPKDRLPDGHANVAVLPFASAWSVVVSSSRNAVAGLTQADTKGNRINGQGFAPHASNTFLHAPHHPVLALATQDLSMIDTPDALLVAASRHVDQEE